MTPRIKKFIVFAFTLLVGSVLLTNIVSVSASKGESRATFNQGTDSTSIAQAATTCTSQVTVTTTADSGMGSLRDAMTSVCSGGTITFDPALTSNGPATITLLSALFDISPTQFIRFANKT